MSDIHYGTGYGKWKHIAATLRTLKKHRKAGLWCEVEELSNPKAQLPEWDKNKTCKWLSDDLGFIEESIYKIDIWGPNPKTTKIGKFIVVQVDKNDNVGISYLMPDHTTALHSCRDAKHVECYVCEIIDEIRGK